MSNWYYEEERKWRPKGWTNGYCSEREHDGMASEAEIFEAGADAMLEKVCGEIEKVENPHPKAYKIGESEAWMSTPQYRGFEEARQKILALFCSSKK